VSTSDIWLVALVILVPAIILWLIFVARSGKPGKARVVLGIPRAMRPGQPDEVLEGPRLERIQVGGVLAVVALTLFIPLYWLPEPDRQEAFAEHQSELAVENGQIIFSEPPVLEEDADPARFKALEKGIALSQNCQSCHGPAEADDPTQLASGGAAPYQEPITGQNVSYRAPPLQNVFTRWDEEIVQFTIERGRPGTPMPAWGVEYGGPMTPQMVEDVMAWLKTLPGNNAPPTDEAGPDGNEISEGCQEPSGGDLLSCGEEIFEVRCAVCHGPEGQGKEDEELNGSIPDPEDDEKTVDVPTWYQGMALWKGDVEHLSEDQHFFTVVNGRRFSFMPAFGEAPPQGTPIPPYPLTDDQIRAVVAYERTL
jgi:mono/diheme cytochrome c family protein